MTYDQFEKEMKARGAYTLEEIIELAKQEWEPRGEESKATDYSHMFWYDPLSRQGAMTLYEGKKRIVRGHDKEEVCWITVFSDGSIGSVPSRTIRKYFECKPGFSFNEQGRQRINHALNIMYGREKKEWWEV